MEYSKTKIGKYYTIHAITNDVFNFNLRSLLFEFSKKRLSHKKYAKKWIGKPKRKKTRGDKSKKKTKNKSKPVQNNRNEEETSDEIVSNVPPTPQSSSNREDYKEKLIHHLIEENATVKAKVQQLQQEKLHEKDKQLQFFQDLVMKIVQKPQSN